MTDTFKAGDKVRVTNYLGDESSHWVGLAGEVLPLVSYREVSVRATNDKWGVYKAGKVYNFNRSELEKIVNSRESTAMSYAEAAQQLQRIKDAGIQVSAVRMEPRSWDNEARFAALIVNGQRLRYNAEVDAFILVNKRRFEKAYVIGNPNTLCTVQAANGKRLFAPDDRAIWSPREVRDNPTFVRDNVEYTLMVKVTEVPIKVALDNDLIK